MNPAPSPVTEAAGLLASGAIFARRVGLRSAADPAAAADILVGFKRGGASAYWGDAPICHFDPEGRWQRAFLDGTHFLKGLDATTQVVDRVREGEQMVLRRRTLGPDEVASLDARIAGLARGLRDDLAAGAYHLVAPPAPARSVAPADLAAFLDEVAGWGPARWAAHRAAYLRAYGPEPIFLPPDCPNPVVLRPTAAMTAAAVADHARAVAALLGRRLGQCRDVFLAGPGWSDRPADAVAALLAAVGAVFAIEPGRGRPRAAAVPEDAPKLEAIHGWLDAAPADPPSAADWGRCRAAHLGRITCRVDPAADLDALGPTLADLGSAGIGVGLVVFLPPTPDAALDRRLAALPLGPGSLITLVAPAAAGPDPAADPAAWKARLAAALPAGGPRVVAYNPDKQWT